MRNCLPCFVKILMSQLPNSSSNLYLEKYAEKENPEPASTSATGAPKRAFGPSSSARSSHSTFQNNDPVLSTLSSIQSWISDMNSRIKAQHPGFLKIFYSPVRLHRTPRQPRSRCDYLEPSDRLLTPFWRQSCRGLWEVQFLCPLVLHSFCQLLQSSITLEAKYLQVMMSTL